MDISVIRKKSNILYSNFDYKHDQQVAIFIKKYFWEILIFDTFSSLIKIVLLWNSL